jgi:hypothetical protein
MKHSRLSSPLSLLALALCLQAGMAAAQPGPGAGRCGPGAAASAAAGDCPARGPGAAHRMRHGPHDTAGWAMMTAAERQAHHDKMAGMKSHDECKAYMDAHHAQMQERAKAKGRNPPPQPRRDACAGLK